GKTVPDVAGRNHLELRAQPSRASAVVRRGDDRDEPLAWRGRIGKEHRPQPAQHVGKPGAAAHRHDTRPGPAMWLEGRWRLFGVSVRQHGGSHRASAAIRATGPWPARWSTSPPTSASMAGRTSWTARW